MFAVIMKFSSTLIMSLYGFYIIKKIIGSNEKLLCIKNISLIMILSIITVFLYRVEYKSIYSIAIFALNIIVYKEIFKQKLEQSLISSGMLMALMFIGDSLITLIFRQFFSLEEMRGIWYIYIVTTSLVILVGIIIVNIRFIRKQLEIFYKNISNKEYLSNIVFLALLVIVLSYVSQNISRTKNIDIDYIANIIIMIIFFILAYLFIKSKNNYNELSSEYDILFSYIQNFEDWIEKEQLNRHEYKNQLAVLRCLTGEKKVKDKIDEILDDNIKIEGEVIQQLKGLPKGGIKGLMYYKSAIAQKNKIRLNINVSIERKSILKMLAEKDIRILCKLIGIYFDNAIEAAKETRKKEVLIEIYELKDKVNIVFSNTFKKNKKFDGRNNKGVSSKGKGRGNGLYFASKLINNNKWLSQKQEIVDKYYIQTLTIHNKNTI